MSREVVHPRKAYPGDHIAVHLGPEPGVDDIHGRSLRAALLTGETLEIADPGESEDIGIDWADPRALKQLGEREPTEPWTWHGSRRAVTGATWGPDGGRGRWSASPDGGSRR